jgi:deoxyribodipyrimidine photolyase
MSEESATVKIDGEGHPQVIPGEKLEISELPPKGDDDQEAKWRPVFSEMKDQLSELKTTQAAETEKFSEFRKTISEQLTELKKQAQERQPSTQPDSPPEAQDDPPEAKPKPKPNESEKPDEPAKPNNEKPEEKPAAPKFQTVVRRRRSI